MTTKRDKDRPWITLCIGGCAVNRIYKVRQLGGAWIDMRIPSLKEYNINGVLCPACQNERDKAFEQAQSRPRMSEKDRILRSYEKGVI